MGGGEAAHVPDGNGDATAVALVVGLARDAEAVRDADALCGVRVVVGVGGGGAYVQLSVKLPVAPA